jgi:hypothetical protein
MPHVMEADAAVVQRAMWAELPAGAEPTEGAFPSALYPLLLSGILTVVPGTNLPPAARPGATLAEHEAAAAAPFVRARTLISLLSLLAIPATYLLARTWFTRPWSLAAAALMGSCAQYLDLSLKAKPHAPFTALAAVALAASVRLVQPSRARDHLVAAVCLALALACPHSGFFLIPAFVLARVLGGRADGRWRERAGGLTFAALAVVITLVLAYPFLLPWSGASGARPETLDIGGHSIRWESWNGRGFGQMLPALFEWDPWLVVGGLCGAGLLVWSALRPEARRGPRAAAVLVLATHAACTILAFGMLGQFYPRFLLPLMPACALLTTFAVERATWVVTRRIAPERTRAVAAGALASLLLCWPLGLGVDAARVAARDDTAKLAAGWIGDHVPIEDVVALDVLTSLPLREEDAELARTPGWKCTPWQRYQRDCMSREDPLPRRKLHSLFSPGLLRDSRGDHDEASNRLRELAPRWVVTTHGYGADSGRDRSEDAARALGATLVAEFDPIRDGRPYRPGELTRIWRMP